MRTQIANLTRILLTFCSAPVADSKSQSTSRTRDQPPAPVHDLPPTQQARGFATSETVRLSPSNHAKISANPKKYSGVTVKFCCKNALAPDLQVRDELGKQVEVGQSAELVARGANVMRGYWSNVEETALAFRDNLFRTGISVIGMQHVSNVPASPSSPVAHSQDGLQFVERKTDIQRPSDELHSLHGSRMPNIAL